MRIALVGTRGVPARYGGFETCVEEVGRRLVKAGHEVVVYCRTHEDDLPPAPADSIESDAAALATMSAAGSTISEYEGMQLVHLGAVSKKALETLSHTALSVAHIRKNPVDVAVVFNSANSPFVPLLRRAGIPVATHVDGLEWKRSKWQGAGSRYYRVAEAMAVRWSDALIADAQGIADYYRQEFDADTELIAYGAPILADEKHELIGQVGVEPGRFHLVVARFEPENHVDMIVDGYRRSSAELPLVVVGSAPYSDEYTARVHELGDDRVIFTGGVWDQELLDQLYANCATYLHGHSVGGTNPSLLRAIGAGAATLAYNVNFNREVLQDTGRYFDDAQDVAALIEDAERHPLETAERGADARRIAYRYDWDDVAARYEALCERLLVTGVRSRRVAG
ncbi:DUF1972 domain-containing protein, partial [Jatrophihabitans endophyticus]|uniref:DUF1972 domain-containing protein n=1 Tax=Jatrophihabitans endophyticus TaxID=1206085 RepID=UPI0019FD3C5B|nr:DUF1972 domain-containing protein [Jatrophihabitans endophyticus]